SRRAVSHQDLQQLNLVIGRSAQLRLREIAVAVPEQKRRGTFLISNRFLDRSEHLFSELAAVVEVLLHDLNRTLMIVRREQDQILRPDAELALGAFAQNGRRYVQAVERVVYNRHAARPIEQRHDAREEARI